ncbi:MAG: hypothetical protein ACKOBW_03215 [Planctomycetota bacterium]
MKTHTGMVAGLWSGVATGRGRIARTLLWGALSIVAVAPLATQAQDTANPPSGLAVKEAGAPEGPAPKRRSEPRGRLPAYYGEVIDNQQREKIYDIQSRVLSQIADLQQRIAQLEQQRDTEVLGVLTAEQVAKVKELTEAAKAKRSENAKRRKPSPDSAGSAESATAANVPVAKP